MDQITLRNRLLVATAMWREAVGEPLPRLAPGEPADQLQTFELQVVDRLWEQATPETAREIADRTWVRICSTSGRSRRQPEPPLHFVTLLTGQPKLMSRTSKPKS